MLHLRSSLLCFCNKPEIASILRSSNQLAGYGRRSGCFPAVDQFLGVCFFLTGMSRIKLMVIFQP
ncbi:hypothetical protein FOC4_g10010428 [Fusarium odoratissimum]|uniref:Uncharacterized protein n=2 Tax=Fusarium oxysporum species complex TaxID=171631 RepID=N1RE12_FUSC4|nr:hypothetical protein FOC4_g10010428 [Fusarium odoratissimum]TXC09635.1 hypothetical protein FocTR4_00005500 [Fusarium oxysporum f. sp. cubense]